MDTEAPRFALSTRTVHTADIRTPRQYSMRMEPLCLKRHQPVVTFLTSSFDFYFLTTPNVLVLFLFKINSALRLQVQPAPHASGCDLWTRPTSISCISINRAVKELNSPFVTVMRPKTERPRLRRRARCLQNESLHSCSGSRVTGLTWFHFLLLLLPVKHIHGLSCTVLHPVTFVYHQH